MRHARRRTVKRRKTILWVIAGVVLVVIGSAAWVGFRAWNAKSDLEAAQSLVGQVKTQATSMDFAGIAQTSELLSKHTSDAASNTHDPVWRVAEFIPVLGKNLTAVREMSEVVDSIAKQTVAPLAKVAGTLTPESLKPVDGKLNIEPISQLSAEIGPAAEAFHAATAKGEAIDVDGTIGQVRDAGAKLSGMLSSADGMVGSAASALQVAPDLLGANGPRKFLLVFPNLAESTALGGSAAALTELTVDDGSIKITRQASSSDFRRADDDPIIEPDPNLVGIYGRLMYSRLNLSPSRPDFPTAAELAKAYWQQGVGGDVDGVISIDPIALSHVLEATGPITMATGDVITSENAVALLLNQIYFRYPDADLVQTNDLTDAFFAAAAKGIFDAVLSPNTDMPKLVGALAQGVSEHRIMAWSSNPEQQAIFADSPLSGILPTTNDKSTMTGVFFRDASASKMDYYLQTAATLNSDLCSATPTFSTTIDLHSNITQEQADALPIYVASGEWGGEKFRTQVFVYGPPGTTVATTSIDAPAGGTNLEGTATDLGRPVVVFTVFLTPGQTSHVTATFTGAEGAYAAPDLRVTPMLNPSRVTLNTPICG